MGNIVCCRQYLSVNTLSHETEKLKNLKIKTVLPSVLNSSQSQKRQRKKGVELEWVILTRL